MDNNGTNYVYIARKDYILFLASKKNSATSEATISFFFESTKKKSVPNKQKSRKRTYCSLY